MSEKELDKVIVEQNLLADHEDAQITDLETGKRLAEEATPGHWHYTPDNDVDDWTLNNDEHVYIKQDDSGVPILKADGEYIAHHNPARMLEMYELVADLRGALEKRVSHGHNDTCDKSLVVEYKCSCGHEKAVAILEKHFPGERKI